MMKSPVRGSALFVILALALALRILFALFIENEYLTADSHNYLRMADAILSDSAYQSFPNGYPLFIAFFKMGLPASAVVPVLVGANILMSVATVYLTYVLARALTRNEGFALLCALALAVYPHQIRFASQVMTESLWGLMAVASLYLQWRDLSALREGKLVKGEAEDFYLVNQFLSGLLWHTAAAVRTSGMAIIPALAVTGLIFRQPRKGVLIFCAGAVLSSLFWFGLERTGFVRTPSATRNNMLVAIASDSRNIQYIQFTPEQKNDAFKTYIQFALKQPGKFLQQRFWALWEMWGFYSFQSGTKALAIRFVILMRFFLFVFSLMALWRYRKSYAVWTLAIPILILTLVHTASFSHHRFSTPLEPMLFILSGLMIRDFLARRHSQTAPDLAL